MVVPRRRRLVLIAATALTSALVLASCGGSSDPAAAPNNSAGSSIATGPSRTGTTAGTSAPTASVPGPDAQSQRVFDAYVAAMNAYVAAVADPPNPDSTDLAAHVGDPLLSEFKKVAGEWRGFGQAAKYPPDSIHRTTLISANVAADKATLEVCSVDDSILYEPATGKVLDNKVSTNRIKATLVPDGASWKLTERSRVEQWEGVAGCAVTQQ